MRKLLLLLIVSITMFSCKKVQYGYWRITFSDDDARPLGPQDFYMNKRSNAFSATGEYDFKGFLLFDEEKKIITAGELQYQDYHNSPYPYYGPNYPAYYSSYTYSNFSGTLTREGGHGTYTYSKVLQDSPNHDTTMTGTGTFELKWLSKKGPKE
jgi:hypothetical protein